MVMELMLLVFYLQQLDGTEVGLHVKESGAVVLLHLSLMVGRMSLDDFAIDVLNSPDQSHYSRLLHLQRSRVYCYPAGVAQRLVGVHASLEGNGE